MIKVNKITPPRCLHYNPEGECIGFLNYFEHLDLRAQIAEQQVLGYSFKLPDGERIYMDKNSRYTGGSDSPYELTSDLLNRIIFANYKPSNKQ
jgi:hypothetical protein